MKSPAMGWKSALSGGGSRLAPNFTVGRNLNFPQWNTFSYLAPLSGAIFSRPDFWRHQTAQEGLQGLQSMGGITPRQARGSDFYGTAGIGVEFCPGDDLVTTNQQERESHHFFHHFP